ncbi:MAG: glycoside hydrolase family 2 protein [Lachnospiraceae bacterium]
MAGLLPGLKGCEIMQFDRIKTALPRKDTAYHGADSGQGKRLISRWGEVIRTGAEQSIENEYQTEMRVLFEYPRPQMVRLKPSGRYQILNGWWDYAILDSRKVPASWDGKILVPFSPETDLSFVRRQLQPDQFLWYERHVEIEMQNQRLLLHFGAVDQNCAVYINGCRISEHDGGYLPFSVEITDHVHEGDNVITLCVQDISDTGYAAKGKQKLRRGGMFYTAQSGIWQTVWMEWVPEEYIEQVHITPDYDNSAFDVEILVNGSGLARDRGYIGYLALREALCIRLYEPLMHVDPRAEGACLYCNGGRKVLRELKSEVEFKEAGDGRRSVTMRVHVPERRSWTPDSPWLYGLEVMTDYDHIASYTAMRCVTVEADDKGVPRICLNHESFFMDGVLDQGYWPESLMTPPSDAAMSADISGIRNLNFNMMRVHCKLQPERFYYHCDRLGMLVWQDMVNGGTAYNLMRLCYLPTFFPHLFGIRGDRGQWDHKRTGRRSSTGRRIWKEETAETIRLLYNHPSIVCWVLFNEGWGQFDAAQACEEVKRLDPVRLVEGASGWFDQKCGDLVSEHNYFRRLRVKRDKKGRAFAISEYGGFSLPMEGHTFLDKVYGYGLMKDRDQLERKFAETRKNIRRLAAAEGLSAAVYTQVSDIEDEVNGLFTWDREICKVPESGS